MQIIYNEKTDRFTFNDLTYDEVTNIGYALITHAMELEGNPKQADLNTLIDNIDLSQSFAF